MRKIKFRTWDSAVMHSWEDLLDERMPVNILDSKNIVMQYTGLEDTKLTEIYEGDIVKYDEYYVGDYLQIAGTMTVVFEDGGFNIDSADIINLSLEVIGNIYEK